MKKRLLSILLCLVMALSLLPTVAFATSSESYYYWSNDNNMEKHDSAPTDDRGYAYYDGNTSIELNNFQYNYSKSGEDYGDYALFDVTGGRPSIKVTLIGNSNIEQSGSGCIYFVKFDKNIEITSEDAATLNITGRSTSNTYEVIWSDQETTATATVSGKATVNISCKGYGLRQGQTYVGGIAFLLKNLILKDSASISVFGDYGSVARRWTHDSVLKFAEGYNATVKMGDSKDSAISYEVPESGLTVSGCYLSVTPNVPVTSYPVWVSGERVTSANASNVLGDGNVSFEVKAGTPTLTILSGANITDGEHQGGLIYSSMSGGLTINAPDGLTLSTTGSGKGILMSDNGPLTINGNVNISTKDRCIDVPGNVIINGNVTVNSSSYEGIRAGHDINVDGSVNAQAGAYGLFSSNGNISISKDVTIKSSYNGIYASNGTVTIASGATWTLDSDGSTILAKDIIIPDDSAITEPADGEISESGSSKHTPSGHTVIAPKAVTATITITKSFIDIADDDRPINTATFTVKKSDGTVYDSAAVGDRAFAGTPAAGQFVWKLEDVPAGTYTITETAYDVDGYSCTVTYKVGTGNEQEGASATATVAAGDDLMITFVDTYTETVTVTFDATGGTCNTDTMTTGADGKLAELPSATPDGTDGVFHGWFTDRQNGDMITTDTVFEEDTTVYALFSYPITVVGGTGSVGDIDTDMIATCPAGKTVTLRVDEEQIPEGKVFDKWVVTEGSFTVTNPENADGATFTSVTEKMVVTATYKNARPGRPDWPFHPGRPTTPTRPAAPTDITAPKTGDSSNMMLWAMLVVMSGAALCGAAMVSKKRKHN